MYHEHVESLYEPFGNVDQFRIYLDIHVAGLVGCDVR